MSELWKALGVLVTASSIAGGAGFFVGDYLKSDKLQQLESDISKERVLNDIDVDEFFFRQAKLGWQVSEKARMQSKLQLSATLIENQIAELDNAIRENSKLKSDIVDAKQEIERLSDLISGEFELLDRVFVPVKGSTVLFPGKIVAAVKMMSGDTVWLTVTDSVTNVATSLGERVKLTGEFDNCSIVPLQIVSGQGAYFQFTCGKTP